MKALPLFFVFLATAASASHSRSSRHPHISLRAATPEPLHATGDQEIDEWLAANKRAPASALTACPLSCSELGNDTSGAGWFLLSDIEKLSAYNETLLIDVVVQTEVDAGFWCTPRSRH
jgi:hypothetical protein